MAKTGGSGTKKENPALSRRRKKESHIRMIGHTKEIVVVIFFFINYN
uniref:Uncharacterized protein n=1 Tax=Rhizophora mucronata TaxID=61149 RepID=A0A2P2NZQ1_RHIMU